MKRARRFLEILAACALAGLLACWLAGYQARLPATDHPRTSSVRSGHSVEGWQGSGDIAKTVHLLPLGNDDESQNSRLPPSAKVRTGDHQEDGEKTSVSIKGKEVVGSCDHHSDARALLNPVVATDEVEQGHPGPPLYGRICFPDRLHDELQQPVIPVAYEARVDRAVVDSTEHPAGLPVNTPLPGTFALASYQEEESKDENGEALSISVNPMPGNPQSADRSSPDQVVNILGDGRGGPPANVSNQRAGEIIPPPLPEAGEKPPTIDGSQITSNQAGLQLELRDADIRDAVHALAKLARLNVVLSSSVQGKVTVSLNGLTPRDAIFAVLRVPGFVLQEHAGVIYVGTEQEIQNLGYITDQISTRIYRPNYTSAKELEALIKPLLTPQIGLTTISTAAENGIAPDPINAGGDKYAGTDVLIVRDYQRVLDEVERIVKEIDVRPAQVAIEAMILSVNLDDKDQFGVSFELLRNRGYIKFGWGLVPQNLNDVKFDNNGMKFAFLDGSIGAFINALESVGDTNVIATPRLLVLNKHRAELLIGKELGYISTTFTETSSSQTVDFLKVGAQLVIRPFISNDGLIRMEVHPELSTGSVQITNNFTVPNKDTTQVTTNIMVPNGVTVVIGGLMREDLETTASQVPFLGNLPLIGGAFRNKTETTRKQEIIVLITPYIVDDYRLAADGAVNRSSWERRQEVAGEQMNGWNKQNASEHFLEKAKTAYAEGRCNAARQWAEMAVQFDPSNMEAIALRDQLSGVIPSNRGPLFPAGN
jgi:type IV pilus assembly protein PilQ